METTSAGLEKHRVDVAAAAVSCIDVMRMGVRAAVGRLLRYGSRAPREGTEKNDARHRDTRY